jgi:methionyl-tRNA formyltransferase
MKNKIIFFGNQKLVQGISDEVTTITDVLEGAGCEVVATIAAKEDLTIVPDLLREHPGAVGVLASFGYIVPGRVIDLFEPVGILNVHPSLLPKYRGSTPIEAAILNGDAETGVSIMKIARAMDAGGVYLQRKLKILPGDDKFTLCNKLTRLGAEAILEVLDGVVKNNITPVAQDEELATYTPRLEKRDGWLKPEEFGAAELERQVRAYLGFPKSKYTFFDMLCTVTKARVGVEAATALDLKCRDGKYICVDRLIPAGRKEMSAEDFLRGYVK